MVPAPRFAQDVRAKLFGVALQAANAQDISKQWVPLIIPDLSQNRLEQMQHDRLCGLDTQLLVVPQQSPSLKAERHTQGVDLHLVGVHMWGQHGFDRPHFQPQHAAIVFHQEWRLKPLDTG